MKMANKRIRINGKLYEAVGDKKTTEEIVNAIDDGDAWFGISRAIDILETDASNIRSLEYDARGTEYKYVIGDITDELDDLVEKIIKWSEKTWTVR